jgi:hypothetical protein
LKENLVLNNEEKKESLEEMKRNKEKSRKGKQ